MYNSTLGRPLKVQKTLERTKTERITILPDSGKTATQPLGSSSVAQAVRWHASWTHYVRGNIVSESAAQLNKTVLLQTMAASGAADDGREDSDGQESQDDPEAPPLTLASDKLQEIILPSVHQEFDVTEQKKAGGKTLAQSLKRAYQQRSMKTITRDP